MERLLSGGKRTLMSVAVLAALHLSGTHSARADGVLADLVRQLPGEGRTFAQPADRDDRAPAADEAARIHALIVADTNDRAIGAAVAKDATAMEQMLRAAFDHPDRRHRLTVQVLVGSEASVARVREYYRQLKCGANDVLLFYFSGHGQMVRGRPPEQSHVLSFGRGSLTRADLRGLMEPKGPRAMILLTDCCSNYVGNNPLGGIKAPENWLGGPGRGAEWALVQTLFLRVRGLVDITAAEDGAAALAGPTGSPFTLALLGLLGEPGRQYRGWEDFYPQLAQRTQRESGRVNPRRAHTPRVFAMGERPAAGLAGLPERPDEGRPAPVAPRPWRPASPDAGSQGSSRVAQGAPAPLTVPPKPPGVRSQGSVGRGQ